MKKIAISILILFLIGIGAGEPLIVKKSAPSEVRINEIFSVNITVYNNYNEGIRVLLRETINFAEPVDKENLTIVVNITTDKNGTIIDGVRWLIPDNRCEIGCKKDNICDPDCRCTVMTDPDCSAHIPPGSPYYTWQFTIDPNSEVTVGYRVKPFGIGIFTIPPTNIGNFYSNSLTIRVKCNENNICERNENYGNCPIDCLSGSEDYYCDKVSDGICDLDCLPGLDPDCLVEVTTTTLKPILCGDGICEINLENHANCLIDCPSGSNDNYCDGVKDGICDPDCLPGLDPDCIEKCGNNVCEYLDGENYANCPIDCRSGSNDNYCDKLRDGICDTDCKEAEDEDCKKVDYTTYIIVFLVLISILWIYKRIRGRKQ